MKSLRLFIGLILIGACQSKVDEPQIEPIAEGKEFNAAFLIIDGVYNSELMAPYDIFQHTIFHTKGGIKVFTIAPKKDTVRTFEGINILPDYDFSNHPDIDILVVPSAEHNMDSDLENEELIAFVKKWGDKAEYSISLCDGAFILAKAGLAGKKKSTTFPSDIKKYKEMFPTLDIVEGVSWVHDRNLLTSAGGAKSYDVALYLVHLLYGEEVAKKVGKGLVIDWKLSDYQYEIVN